MTGRQFQFRLQRLTVLAHGVLDQIATEVTVDLEQILQAPSNLSVSQTAETKVSLIRVRKHTVKLFLYLGNEGFSIAGTGLNGVLGRHVAGVDDVDDFLDEFRLGKELAGVGDLLEVDLALDLLLFFSPSSSGW